MKSKKSEIILWDGSYIYDSELNLHYDLPLFVMDILFVVSMLAALIFFIILILTL